MPVLIAGIDEAGYGPLLGPLCVGLSVFRVQNVSDPAKLPDLWTILSDGVCRQAARAGKNDSRGRVAVADSKQLKLSNSVKTTHPLIHLERGVLTFANCLSNGKAIDDRSLFSLLSASLTGHPCYADAPIALPLVLTSGQVGIATNILSSALTAASVDLADLRCEIVDEAQYNQIIKDTGNKAETTATAIGRHLRRVWELYATEPPDTRLGIVCDRLGGRAQYSGLLERELDGCTVEVVEESDLKSRYVISGPDARGHDRRASVSFLVEGESIHLPIALASMVAKFVRELAMIRFNQHWSRARLAAGGAEIKPTAGYYSDAQRWLEEIGQVMTPDDRRQLVRLL